VAERRAFSHISTPGGKKQARMHPEIKILSIRYYNYSSYSSATNNMNVDRSIAMRCKLLAEAASPSFLHIKDASATSSKRHTDLL